MQRFKVTIAYDGSAYVGFQRQINGNTVQEEIEKALRKASKGNAISVVASGRTDSGVHAKGQVIHFDYPAKMPCDAMQRALNSLLPEDIRVVAVEHVSQLFHARYHTSGKRYEYRVSVSKVQNPFKAKYTLHHAYRLDIERMQCALNDVLGTHDFTSFCSTKTDKENLVRTVTRASIHEDKDNEEIIFTFEGDGFLYNMVRILVGTSLQIGNGLKDVTEMKRLLDVRDRNEAGPTAPPHALYLMQVNYKPENQWFQTYEENKKTPN
ncbi:tRNA pseudouridine(38-40) synthase TruA [Carnobacteriaceae bacterium zg-C25]|nr:tRNA pseudouridine(38-40) synthase TruA [Carnobacteriaceae bacterium zg-C25]